MGLFNAVFKGVKIEKRKPKTRSAEAEMDVEELETLESEVSIARNTAQSAASILFENTERQGAQYDQTSQYLNGYGTTGAGFGFGGSAIGGASYGNRNILVVTPSTNAEVTKIVTNLRNGDACVVCLEGLDATDAQRRLDFLSGVICAMNGTIESLNANTFILTPTGIGIKKPQ